jgi:hypothetical protein
LPPKSRKALQARAKVRALAVVEASLNGVRSQPGEGELNKLLDQVRSGKNWEELFPGVASLELATDGAGIGIAIRLTKSEGEPVHLVPEGTPGATVVSVKRVNELGFYSLGLKDLAEKMGLSAPRVLALIKHLKLQEKDEFFRDIRIGKVNFKRYSPNALKTLQETVKVVEMDKVWELHRPTGKPKKGKP